MKSKYLILHLLTVLLIVSLSCSQNSNSTSPNYSNSESIQLQGSKSNSATDLIKSLSPNLQKTVLMPIDDISREKWSYLPTTYFDRKGVEISELDSKQKDLAFKLLESHLSKTGFEKTQKIIELEKVLAKIENNSRTRDSEKYSIAIYGDPSTEKLWAWSFEGHHVSLNFTISDDKTSITPRFFGANPAIIRDGKRKGERTLAEEQDLAFELLNSLNTKQKQTAVFKDSTFYDISTKSSSKVTPLEPVGIKYAMLNASQKDVLQKLLGVYLSAMPEEVATKRMKNLKTEELDKIRFGWAGATTKDQPHYYRIQGKTFLIEFDNSQNNANHIHSVWRDFDGDFGRDMIKEHYQKSDHH